MLDLFDCNFRAGLGNRGGYTPAATPADVLRVLDSYEVRRALVWHVAQLEHAATRGNELLTDLVRGQDRLVGCWTLLPPQTREMPAPPQLFRDMTAAGVKALRLFPSEHQYIADRVVLGSLLDAATEHRIPILVSLTLPGLDWRATYRLLEDFPDLTCILCDTGVWGQDRYFRPLIEKYPRVYVETSLLSLGDGVVEALVRDYGAGRLVYGSGFPDREPEAAILQLLHAPIPESDRQAIGSGNLDRLLAEVKL